MNYDDQIRYFWDNLVEKRTALPGESEALILAHVIDSAFTGMSNGDSDAMVVDHELVQYMAGWMRDKLRGEAGHENTRVIGRHGQHANHFLDRAFKALFATVRQRVIEEHKCIWDREGQTFFAGLEIPQVLVKIWRKEAVEMRERRREIMARPPLYVAAGTDV